MFGENSIAIDVHASELIEHEGLAVQSDTSLRENNRSRALNDEGDGNNNKGREENYNRRHGDHKVHHSPYPP